MASTSFAKAPLALDLDQAQRMRDAARRAGRLLQVGLLMRSVSAYGHVEAVARSGEHGRLLSITTWRLGSYLHADALRPQGALRRPVDRA